MQTCMETDIVLADARRDDDWHLKFKMTSKLKVALQNI